MGLICASDVEYPFHMLLGQLLVLLFWRNVYSSSLLIFNWVVCILSLLSYIYSSINIF